MEDLLDLTDERVQLSDKEIFKAIWTSPKRIFKFINDNHYERYATILLMLSGISRCFGRSSYRNMGSDMSLLANVFTCVVSGCLFGWIGYYIYAALISWTGKWLKAQGDTNSILRVLSYALLPSVLALLLFVVKLLIYGNELFKTAPDPEAEEIFSTPLQRCFY